MKANKKVKRFVIKDEWDEDPYGKIAHYTCSVCGMEVDAESCDQCEDGLSGHDCGDDTCCCLRPEPNIICDSCGGTGYWWYCLTCKAYIRQGNEVVKKREDEVKHG